MWYVLRKKFFPWLLTNQKHLRRINHAISKGTRWPAVNMLRVCYIKIPSPWLHLTRCWSTNKPNQEISKSVFSSPSPPPFAHLLTVLLLPQLSHVYSRRNACLAGYHYSCGMCPPRDLMMLVVWALYIIQLMLPFWDNLQGDNPWQRGQEFKAIRDLYIQQII